MSFWNRLVVTGSQLMVLALLVACVRRTPTPAPPATQPLGPGAGYPAAEPSPTVQAGGYPAGAETVTPVPSYP